MDKQLLWLIDKFEKFDIKYWCDSGTLLGLIRDGVLIDGDNDIDIGITFKEIYKMNAFFNSLKKYNCAYTLEYYNGVFKYKFKLNKDGKRIIDVNVFNKEDRFMICPQPVLDKQNKFTYFLVVIIQKVISAIYYIGFLHKKKFSDFPWNFLYKFKYWVIDDYHFENLDTIQIDGKLISIPSHAEDYLHKRYGDWKKPNPNWDFLTDDNCLKDKVHL